MAVAHAAEQAEARAGAVGAAEHQGDAQGERRQRKTKVH
jgi:hypothetical protein